MRPVSPQPPVFNNRSGYGAGGYRAWAVIGAILIGLAVIGLAGDMLISPLKVSNNFENISGLDPGRDTNFSEIPENNMGYYQGVLGMYRMANTRGSSGRDLGR